MKNIVLTAAIILATSLTAIAGGKNTTTSTLKGKVLDSNNEVIAGALVSVEGMTEKVYTDFDGNFEINTVSGKSVNVSFVSFEDKKIEVTSIEKEMTIVLGEK
jgi:hypothetical protein